MERSNENYDSKTKKNKTITYVCKCVAQAEALKNLLYRKECSTSCGKVEDSVFTSSMLWSFVTFPLMNKGIEKYPDDSG